MFNRDSIYSDAFQVGQRVRCSLPFCGFGIIVGIEGEQAPETCRTIAGIGVTGGSAHLTIVWESGSRSHVPETLTRASVQWEVLPEVVSAQEVTDALDLAEQTEREAAEAKTRADREFEAAKAKLVEDAAFSGLKRADQAKSTRRRWQRPTCVSCSKNSGLTSNFRYAWSAAFARCGSPGRTARHKRT